MSGRRRKQSGRRSEVSLADRLEPTSPPNKQPTKKQNAGAPSRSTASSRRAARQERKQRARKRWAVLAVVVVAVLVVGLAAAWWLGREEDEAPPPPSDSRTERTLTLTLGNKDEPASSGAILITDPDSGSADGVLIPSRVFVEGPTPDGLPFGETVLLGSPDAPGVAMADSLDVVIDGTWQLSSSSLAQLVDGVGGVLVDVNTEVDSPQSDGDQRVVIPEGDDQLLDGAQAAVFAQYLGPGEPEESRLARLGQVLDQLARRMPEEQAEVVALLKQTGSDEVLTESPEELADFLVSFGDGARAGVAGFEVLPTIPLEIGGPRPSLTIDPVGVERLRQGVLSGSLPPSAAGTDIEVLVQNGVGTPGLEQDAADLLRAEGYEFLNGGNANEFDNKETDVVIPDSSPASVELGTAVAQTLGVPDSAVKYTDQPTSVADVIVILGADFDP